MSMGVAIVCAILAALLIGGPIAKAIGSSNPLIGVIAGVVVFVVLSALGGKKK
jgi:hypothetical protein